MPDRNAIPSRVAVRRIIENAIRDTSRRGMNGYDELARGVMEALDRNHLVVGTVDSQVAPPSLGTVPAPDRAAGDETPCPSFGGDGR